MYAGRHHHLEHELLRWLILVLLAGSLVLFAARTTFGQVGTADHETGFTAPTLPQTAQDLGPAEFMPTPDWLWRILEDHQAGHDEAAILRWGPLALETDVQVWRTTAVGAAYLRQGQLDHADCTLMEAIEGGKANAVTRHLAGIVKYAQSNEAAQQGQAQRVDHLRDAARDYLQGALATAAEIDLEQPLVTFETQLVALRPNDTVAPNQLLATQVPRVRDLLVALDLIDFELKTHMALAEVNLAQGYLTEAEAELDAVTAAGEEMSVFYRELARKYTRAGEPLAAKRSYLKSLAGDPHKASTLLRALRHMPH